MCNNFVELSGAETAIIVIVVIISLALITAGAFYVAKKYKDSRVSEQCHDQKAGENKVKQRPLAATPDSQQTTGMEIGHHGPHLKQKRKRTKRSSSKIISGTERKGQSGSRATP